MTTRAGRRAGGIAILAIGVPALVVTAFAAVFVLKPWSKFAPSDSSSGQFETPEIVAERADFPDDLCVFIGADLLTQMVPRPRKEEPEEGYALFGKNVGCSVDSKLGSEDSRYLRVSVERDPDSRDPVKEARDVFEVGCDGLDDDYSLDEGITRPLKDASTVGDDVCGSVQADQEHDSIAVDLYSVDGPDSISLHYALYDVKATNDNAKKVERDLVEFSRKFFEKLRS